jgi:hypothetical protein
MMPDTNQVAQAAATAVAIHEQVSANWPAICAASVIVARELRNFNAWCLGVAEFVIKHGGGLMIVKKLLWNPDADQNPLAK